MSVGLRCYDKANRHFSRGNLKWERMADIPPTCTWIHDTSEKYFRDAVNSPSWVFRLFPPVIPHPPSSCWLFRQNNHRFCSSLLPSSACATVSTFLLQSTRSVRHRRGKPALPLKLFRDSSTAFTRVSDVGALKTSRTVIFAQVNRVRNIGTILNISLLIKIHEFSRYKDADYHLTWRSGRINEWHDILARQARAKRPESRSVHLKLLGLEWLWQRQLYQRCGGNMLSPSCTAVASLWEHGEGRRRRGRGPRWRGLLICKN